MYSLNTGEPQEFYSAYPDTANLALCIRYIEKNVLLAQKKKFEIRFLKIKSSYKKPTKHQKDFFFQKYVLLRYFNNKK